MHSPFAACRAIVCQPVISGFGRNRGIERGGYSKNLEGWDQIGCFRARVFFAEARNFFGAYRWGSFPGPQGWAPLCAERPRATSLGSAFQVSRGGDDRLAHARAGRGRHWMQRSTVQSPARMILMVFWKAIAVGARCGVRLRMADVRFKDR